MIEGTLDLESEGLNWNHEYEILELIRLSHEEGDEVSSNSWLQAHRSPASPSTLETWVCIAITRALRPRQSQASTVCLKQELFGVIGLHYSQGQQ